MKIPTFPYFIIKCKSAQLENYLRREVENKQKVYKLQKNKISLIEFTTFLV